MESAKIRLPGLFVLGFRVNWFSATVKSTDREAAARALYSRSPAEGSRQTREIYPYLINSRSVNLIETCENEPPIHTVADCQLGFSRQSVSSNQLAPNALCTCPSLLPISLDLVPDVVHATRSHSETDVSSIATENRESTTQEKSG